MPVRGEPDQPFRGDATGFLGGLGEALGSEPIDRGLHVAAGLAERGLAIHHACAGLVAQVLHHGRGNRRHCRLCVYSLSPEAAGLGFRPGFLPSPLPRGAPLASPRSCRLRGRASAFRAGASPSLSPSPSSACSAIGSSAAPRSVPIAPCARSIPSIAARATKSQ